jgi:hypothetical protein
MRKPRGQIIYQGYKESTDKRGASMKKFNDGSSLQDRNNGRRNHYKTKLTEF